MKTFSFGLATAIAMVLFGAFGSVGMRARASVSTRVVAMYAVLPDGALVDTDHSTRIVRRSSGGPRQPAVSESSTR
jgi:hypothetical protein